MLNKKDADFKNANPPRNTADFVSLNKSWGILCRVDSLTRISFDSPTARSERTTERKKNATCKNVRKGERGRWMDEFHFSPPALLFRELLLHHLIFLPFLHLFPEKIEINEVSRSDDAKPRKVHD